jgi:hypothetical protein
MSMIEQNNPATLERARKKIGQLGDATDRADLDLRFSVASGWLAALRLEGLVDGATFHDLNAELNEAHKAPVPHLDQEQFDALRDQAKRALFEAEQTYPGIAARREMQALRDLLGLGGSPTP